MSTAFKTSYAYVSPHSAGPFKGSMTTPIRYKRGDEIHAPFGVAVVKSSREVKPKNA